MTGIYWREGEGKANLQDCCPLPFSAVNREGSMGGHTVHAQGIIREFLRRECTGMSSCSCRSPLPVSHTLAHFTRSRLKPSI